VIQTIHRIKRCVQGVHCTSEGETRFLLPRELDALTNFHCRLASSYRNRFFSHCTCGPEFTDLHLQQINLPRWTRPVRLERDGISRACINPPCGTRMFHPSPSTPLGSFVNPLATLANSETTLKQTSLSIPSQHIISFPVQHLTPEPQPLSSVCRKTDENTSLLISERRELAFARGGEGSVVEKK